MLEVLEFIFSSFWVWAGFTITLIGSFEALSGLIRVIINKKS